MQNKLILLLCFLIVTIYLFYKVITIKEPFESPTSKVKGSCNGNCGEQDKENGCWCDKACKSYGDCCPDVDEVCKDMTWFDDNEFGDESGVIDIPKPTTTTVKPTITKVKPTITKVKPTTTKVKPTTTTVKPTITTVKPTTNPPKPTTNKSNQKKLKLTDDTIHMAVSSYYSDFSNKITILHTKGETELELKYSKDDIIDMYGLMKDWDVSDVTNMRGLFSQDYFIKDDGVHDKDIKINLEFINLDKTPIPDDLNLDNALLVVRKGMQLTVSRFNYTPNYIPNTEEDITNWNTKNVINTDNMFRLARNANESITSNWNLDNVKSDDGMFTY